MLEICCLPQKKTQTSTTNPTTDEAQNDFPFPLGTANQPSTHRFGNCLVCLSLMWHQSQKGVKFLSPKTLDFFGPKWCENTVFLLTNAENSKFEAQEWGFGLLLVFPHHFGLMFWFKMLNFRGVFKFDVHSSIFIETLWNRVEFNLQGDDFNPATSSRVHHRWPLPKQKEPNKQSHGLGLRRTC